MPNVSVIIPARNETWLLKTIESIRSAIRGDTEIIALIDGEEAAPHLPAEWPDGPKVRIIRNAQSLGQRACVNIGARASAAKYILKTDAHSMMDEGFDVKLMADCEYDWTVLPRMYNLHAFDVVCKACGTRLDNREAPEKCEVCKGIAFDHQAIWKPKLSKKTDFMWFRSNTCQEQPFRVQYWDGPTGRTYPVEYEQFRRWARHQPQVCDVMTGQGACFFMHRNRFWDLGGMDENHGSWGQVGIEVALKAWLSGGRHVVNRKTWFAHLFRGGSGPGFPYHISGNDQERARQYSQKLWTSGSWPLQKRPLAWLIEKFWPVPTWEKPVTATELRDAAPIAECGVRSAESPLETEREPDLMTVLYYSDNRLPEAFRAAVQQQMEKAAGGLPVVYQWQPPDWPRSHESIYRNILAGLELVKTPYVALAEHDVLYPEGYFDHRPVHEIEYNKNRWCLHADRGVFSRRPAMAMSQCFARTYWLKREIKERLNLPVTFAGHSDCFEPGKRNKELGIPESILGRFKSRLPTVDITGHGGNLTGPKRPRGKTRERLKPWGTAAEVIKRFHVPRNSETTEGTETTETERNREILEIAAAKANAKPRREAASDQMDALQETVIYFPAADIRPPRESKVHKGEPRRICGKCGHHFGTWNTPVIGVSFEPDSAEEYNIYGCPKCHAEESNWRPEPTKSTTSIPSRLEDCIAKNSPVVSVLIPARNEKYLQQTIDDLHKHLALDYEILVGLDGYEPDPPLVPHDRLRIVRSEKPIGMRPMINVLAREARGAYLLRMDAHCAVAKGIDAELVGTCEREGHVTVVAQRYELDAKRWKRRNKTDVPYRRLSHVSEDGKGLRSLPWPEYAKGRENIDIDETMSCSGSSWTCLRSTFVDWWGGFDEQHGTFGQEGCEIACMTWLSGGRFLVDKRTWYAHWNRGHAPYAMGPHTKDKSIERSQWLWPGNHWKHARYGFDWLLEKFHPPGWPAPEVGPGIAAVEQRCLLKSRKRLRVDDLWNSRDAIADPGKRHRLQIFWRAYDAFVRSVLAGTPESDGQYYRYLLSHVNRHPGRPAGRSDIRKAGKSIAGSIRLIQSIRAEGLKAPLEFYIEDGRMILWKGYRRLVIARALGIPSVVGRCYGDRTAAGQLSPQLNLTRLANPATEDLHRLAEEQFRKWGHGATDKYFTHGYTRHYDVHFHQIRKRVKKVLELGLLNGASLALWRDYFPRADLVGVDIDPDRWKKFAGNLDRTTILIGDETDDKFVRGVGEHGPFDVIVDDASHDPALQAKAFDGLWPAVRQYGYYVIEDIFRSYDGREGDRGRCIPAGLEDRIYGQRDVLSIHHYYNIVFIQKG